jgi:hypothetical protein
MPYRHAQLGSHFDSETADALYTWTLPEWTTDRLLHQLLSSMPPEDPNIKPSGSLTITTIPRCACVKVCVRVCVWW